MAPARGTLHKVGDPAPLSSEIELADSFWSRFLGLMGRSSLPAGRGLWLTGTGSIHMLFMRFPIDAIFLGQRAPGGSRPILAIRENLRPWIGLVWLVRGAQICLELPAGRGAAFSVGDQLIYDLDR